MNHRLAIAVEEINNKEIVADHFGRCTKFNVYEVDEDKRIVKKESFFNPLAGEEHGSCQLPRYINQFNINTIIAGGMGQKAISNFLSFGIKVITASGLEDLVAVSKFLEGELSGYETCNHHNDHHHHRHGKY